MNMYSGNVPKPEPHFGWKTLILLFNIHICCTCLAKKNFDLVDMPSSFVCYCHFLTDLARWPMLYMGGAVASSLLFYIIVVIIICVQQFWWHHWWEVLNMLTYLPINAHPVIWACGIFLAFGGILVVGTCFAVVW